MRVLLHFDHQSIQIKITSPPLPFYFQHVAIAKDGMVVTYSESMAAVIRTEYAGSPVNMMPDEVRQSSKRGRGQ